MHVCLLQGILAWGRLALLSGILKINIFNNWLRLTLNEWVSKIFIYSFMHFCRYCSGKFPAKTEVTIGVDFREKCVEIDGETIKVRSC